MVLHPGDVLLAYSLYIVICHNGDGMVVFLYVNGVGVGGVFRQSRVAHHTVGHIVHIPISYPCLVFAIRLHFYPCGGFRKRVIYFRVLIACSYIRALLRVESVMSEIVAETIDFVPPAVRVAAASRIHVHIRNQPFHPDMPVMDGCAARCVVVVVGELPPTSVQRSEKGVVNGIGSCFREILYLCLDRRIVVLNFHITAVLHMEILHMRDNPHFAPVEFLKAWSGNRKCHIVFLLNRNVLAIMQFKIFMRVRHVIGKGPIVMCNRGRIAIILISENLHFQIVVIEQIVSIGIRRVNVC